MLLSELFEVETEIVMEGSKVAWARRSGKVVRKFRCTSGQRKGRIVNSPGDCNKPIDIKRRVKMRQTIAAKGTRMTRKSKRTKARDPASLRVKRLNIAAGSGQQKRKSSK